MNKLRWIFSAGVLAGLLHQPLQARCCGQGGGGVRCDAASGFMVCSDGSIDKTCRCGSGRRRPAPVRKRTLTFPDPTARGQILKPGEKAPSSTLKDSK